MEPSEAIRPFFRAVTSSRLAVLTALLALVAAWGVRAYAWNASRGVDASGAVELPREAPEQTRMEHPRGRRSGQWSGDPVPSDAAGVR